MACTLAALVMSAALLLQSHPSLQVPSAWHARQGQQASWVLEGQCVELNYNWWHKYKFNDWTKRLRMWNAVQVADTTLHVQQTANNGAS